MSGFGPPLIRQCFSWNNSLVDVDQGSCTYMVRFSAVEKADYPRKVLRWWRRHAKDHPRLCPSILLGRNGVISPHAPCKGLCRHHSVFPSCMQWFSALPRIFQKIACWFLGCKSSTVWTSFCVWLLKYLFQRSRWLSNQIFYIAGNTEVTFMPEGF